MLTPEILQLSRETMEKHARTFDRASSFFPASLREDARLLYLWCRFCDDYIDHAENTQEASTRVERLLEGLNNRQAFVADPASQDLHTAFLALSYLQEKYRIPDHYPRELILGMHFDAHYKYFESEQELYLYCYRVASVVGLMMCHMMGISRESALKQAADLGTAMQLSNMARDIYEDFQMNRIYAPKTWWPSQTINHDADMMKQCHPQLCQEFVMRSRQFYRSASQGLDALPLRCALAISSAIELYSEIGEQALRSKDWKKRAVVPTFTKARLIIKALFKAVLSRSVRRNRRFNPIEIQQVKTFDENIQLS